MAIKLSTTEAKAKLDKVNLAVKQLIESKLPSDIKRKKLLQLKEVKSSLTTILTEEKREYTSEESEAVGLELLKTLEKAIRGTKGELASKPEVTGQVNGFNIHTVYGRDKGEDNFKFKLNPDDGKIYLKSGREEKEVAPFEVTEANQVNIDKTVDLEKVLRDLLTKYTSEPTDQDYDAQAKMKLPHDDSQINKFIAERKLALRESLGKNATVGDYVEDFVTSDAPQFKGKSKAKRIQMAKAAALKAKPMKESVNLDNYKVGDQVKFTNGEVWKVAKPGVRGGKVFLAPFNDIAKKGHISLAIEFTADQLKDTHTTSTMKEDLDIGHEDNEPNMLKGDLYKLMRNAVDLYKAMQALEGQGEVDFPQWWQGKILSASDDIQCAKEYLEFEMQEPAIDAAVSTLGEEVLDEIVFNIAGLGTYTSTKGDADTITGVDTAGTVKTFSRKKIEQDNPGIFEKKPREKKPQGVRPYTESQYRKVLQGAIDDAGSTEFAYDIAESMILDPQILARLAKDYPEAGARELKQRLQWDLEACDSPEDDYDNDYEGEVAEVALNEKKATYCGKCKTTHVKGTPCPTKEGVVDETSKPDYIDLDKDGNRKESMKKAAQDAKVNRKSTK